jgi:hypothetical protein
MKSEVGVITHRDHLLIVCYAYPPFKSIGSIRNYYFTKELSKCVASTDLLSTSNINVVGTIEGDLSHICDKKYLPTIDYTFFKEYFGKRKNSKTGTIQSKKIIVEIKHTTTFLEKLTNSFPFNILFYGGIFYLIFGIIHGLRRSKKNSVIYSSFIPYVDHVIAYIIKLCKPNTFWIADFRDFQTFPHEEKLIFPRFQHWINRKIFSKADIVTNVTAAIADYNSKYNAKSICITNGVPIDFISVNKSEKVANSFFSIVYTGMLYKGKRNAESVFTAVKELIDEKRIDSGAIKLIYAGSEGSYWDTWATKTNLNSCTINYGVLPHEKAVELQQNASINLAMNWVIKESLGAFGGKFFEYLLSEVPILMLLSGEKDSEIERANEEINFGIVTYDFEADNVRFIKQFILEHYLYWTENKTCKRIINKDGLQKYQWENIMAPLKKIIFNM